MQPTDPFDRHPAAPESLANHADTLVRLADEAGDQEVLTDQAFAPARASWDGLAAAALQAAPRPVRHDARAVASTLAWAAVPLLAWADHVRTFNRGVDHLLDEYAAVPVEVERFISNRYPGPAELWPLADLDTERGWKREELVGLLRQRWYRLFQQHIDEGAREVVDMLRRGPTWEHLATARELGLLPAGPLAAFFVVEWGKTAALAEVERIGQLVVGGPHSPPTLDELERLGQILADYADDPEFSYRLLTGLGQEGLLVLTAAVAGLVGERSDPDWQAAVQAVQSGLATALATATTRRGTGDGSEFDPYRPAEYELDDAWVLRLALTGQELITIDRLHGPIELYGYQALGVLLSQGGFDANFLGIIGADLIDFEISQGGSEFWLSVQEQPNLEGLRLNWLHGPEHPAGFDPMIGLWEALAESPEGTRRVLTSRSYLDEVPLEISDPGGTQVEVWRLPRLDYLLTDRLWPPDRVVDPATAHLGPTGPRPGLVAFGEALDGATRIAPDARSYHIVESIILETAVDEQARGFPNGEVTGWADTFSRVDLIHPELRPYLGNIVDYYIQDVFWALADTAGSGVSDNPPYQQRLDLDNLKPHHLQLFLADLGKDAAARSTVAAAQLDYALTLYDHYLQDWADVGDHPSPRVETVTGRISDLLALLDVGATGQLRADLEAGDLTYNEALRHRFWFGELGATTLSGLPGGRTGEHLVLTVLEQWEQSLRQDSTAEANLHHHSMKQMTREVLADMITHVTYSHVTAQLTPAEFLDRVSETDAATVQALIYPDGHPRAGEFIPTHEWGDDQFTAWGTFYTADANGGIDYLIEKVKRDYELRFLTGQDDLERGR